MGFPSIGAVFPSIGMGFPSARAAFSLIVFDSVTFFASVGLAFSSVGVFGSVTGLVSVGESISLTSFDSVTSFGPSPPRIILLKIFFSDLLAKFMCFLFLNVLMPLSFLLLYFFFFKLCFLTLYNLDILPLVNFISI